jgi:tetratricopeptide (TPR) repeat protein
MRKKMIFVFFVSVFMASVSLTAATIQDAENLYAKRNTLTPENGESLIALYPDLLSKDPQNYKLLCLYSKALNFYGMYFAADDKVRKDCYQKARDAAQTATLLNPEDVEGHVWLATSLGNWGQINGVLNSLKVVPNIERNMNEVLTKDPLLYEAIAYRVLGRLYFMAPESPFSVGDREKAEKYLKKAIELAPANKKNYYYLADLYVSNKLYKEAMALMEKAESTPARPEFRVEDQQDLKDIAQLKARIAEKLPKK